MSVPVLAMVVVFHDKQGLRVMDSYVRILWVLLTLNPNSLKLWLMILKIPRVDLAPKGPAGSRSSNRIINTHTYSLPSFPSPCH